MQYWKKCSFYFVVFVVSDLLPRRYTLQTFIMHCHCCCGLKIVLNWWPRTWPTRTTYSETLAFSVWRSPQTELARFAALKLTENCFVFISLHSPVLCSWLKLKWFFCQARKGGLLLTGEHEKVFAFSSFYHNCKNKLRRPFVGHACAKLFFPGRGVAPMKEKGRKRKKKSWQKLEPRGLEELFAGVVTQCRKVCKLEQHHLCKSGVKKPTAPGIWEYKRCIWCGRVLLDPSMCVAYGTAAWCVAISSSTNHNPCQLNATLQLSNSPVVMFNSC